MGKYKIKSRSDAVERGLLFIYRISLDSNHFTDYGSNLLYFFNFVASTSLDSALSRLAHSMARERFLEWKKASGGVDHRKTVRDLSPEEITDLVLGNHAAERSGIKDQDLKQTLRRLSRHYSATDFLWFDPRREPPPSDIPEVCQCGRANERGLVRCGNRRCRQELTMMSRYKVWYVALTAVYCGERYGVRLGASYRDVVQWLPLLRPYRGPCRGRNSDFYDTVYAISHLIYTLNDYGVYLLPRRLLQQEYLFLKEYLPEAIRRNDPDMTGEFLDSLLALGMKDNHPTLRQGIDYLLSTQNEDGSWGNPKGDAYTLYHTTWAVIDGLREYRWRGQRLSFPRLQSLFESWVRG